MCCFSQGKKKRKWEGVLWEETAQLSQPHRYKLGMSHLSVFILGFILDFLEFEFFVSCFGFKDRMSLTPLFSSISQGLIFRDSFPGLTFHLCVPNPVTHLLLLCFIFLHSTQYSVHRTVLNISRHSRTYLLDRKIY